MLTRRAWPATSTTSTPSLPVGVIWDFVREMDHWAPLLTGYQKHEKQSDTESIWTLKGDVGMLARTLRFRCSSPSGRGQSG